MLCNSLAAKVHCVLFQAERFESLHLFINCNECTVVNLFISSSFADVYLFSCCFSGVVIQWLIAACGSGTSPSICALGQLHWCSLWSSSYSTSKQGWNEKLTLTLHPAQRIHLFSAFGSAPHDHNDTWLKHRWIQC